MLKLSAMDWCRCGWTSRPFITEIQEKCLWKAAGGAPLSSLCFTGIWTCLQLVAADLPLKRQVDETERPLLRRAFVGMNTIDLQVIWPKFNTRGELWRPPNLCFNISHTESLIACGVTLGSAVR